MDNTITGKLIRRGDQWQLTIEIPRWLADEIERESHEGARWQQIGVGTQGPDKDAPAFYTLALATDVKPFQYTPATPPLFTTDDILAAYRKGGPKNPQIRMFATLPDGAAQIISYHDGVSMARMIDGTHLYFCVVCDGWVMGEPIQQRIDTMDRPLSGRSGLLVRCRRCEHELAFRGAVS